MLNSTVTPPPWMTVPAASDAAEGSGGDTSWTNLDPNTVEEVISAPTLAGMADTAAGSMARRSAARPSGSGSIDATLPTWAPFSLTLASGYMTNPARSVRTVTGNVVRKLSWNSPTARATMAARATTVSRPVNGRT